MQIQGFTVGPVQSNCYMVWNDQREALVIDPGDDAAVLADFLDRAKLKVVAYLLTHGHVDHVSALADLHDVRPAPIALHPADAQWAFTRVNALPPWCPAPRDPGGIERELADGQDWEDAGWPYRVIATPGHTPGGVCFHFPKEKLLFSGDTLFQGSVGRTDLPGGNSRTLAASLRKLVELLPDDTRVLPGHGPETTIGQEKRQNFFLREI